MDFGGRGVGRFANRFSRKAIWPCVAHQPETLAEGSPLANPFPRPLRKHFLGVFVVEAAIECLNAKKNRESALQV